MEEYNECIYGQYFVLQESKVYVKKQSIAPLYVILNYEYPFILKAMLLDGFFIVQDKTYDFVKEIVCEDEIVGFTALNFYEDSLIMELCYILPDFRGKGLFVDELNIIKKEFDRELWLDLPNRFAIESLIDNGLACKINEVVVKTSVFLTFHHPLIEGRRLSTCFYDLRICACVDLNNYFLSPLLDVDIFCFDADKRRDLFVDVDYFTDMKTIMLK